MSSLQCTRHDDLFRSLRQIKKEKAHLEARWRDMNRRLQKVANNQERFFDMEEWESSLRLVSSAADDLEVYLEHIETEIEKVEWGIDQLQTLPKAKATQAFVTYITKDTKLSLQNLKTAREMYDQVVKDIAQIARFSDDEY